MILYGRINGGIDDIDATTANFEFKIPRYDPWGCIKANYDYVTCSFQNSALISQLLKYVENFTLMYVKGKQITSDVIVVDKVFIPKTFQLFQAK